MKTAEQMWSVFSRIIPAEAGMVQRLEMQRTFYAGLLSLLGELQTCGDESVGEDEGVAYLNSLAEEVKGVLAGFVLRDFEGEGTRH